MVSGQPHISLIVTLLSLAITAHVAAQDVFFVCDSANDAVYRMVDVDADGVIDPVTEVSVFYDDSSAGPDLSTPSHLLPYQDGVLLADGGTLDAILYLEDLNGDGDANDIDEVVIFYDDSSPNIDLSVPNCMIQCDDGSVLVADDGSAVRSILRLVDSNGDGDANDDGEATVIYDSSALSPPDPITDPESLAVTPEGVIYVGDTVTGTVFRLEDLNSDGDALDAGEATSYYSGISGVALTDIDALALDSSGGLYAIDEDSGTTLYLTDGNGDGDALDAGESVIFLDASNPGPAVTDPNDAMLVADGQLILADGALDAVLVAEDLNGDGDALDDGEVTFLFDDAGALLATPSGIVLVATPSAFPPPVVTSIDPASGPTAGGTTVVIAGSELSDAFSVMFGAFPASFTVVDDFTIEATTPAAPAGPVDVTVETPGGSASLIDAFDYVAPTMLVITAVTPSAGDTSGGESVTVAGTGWDSATPVFVRFDGFDAVVDSISASTIVVTTPPHAAALVDVEVEQGAFSVVAGGAYRYQNPFVRGDVDVNGTLGIPDPIALLSYLFVGGTPEPPCLDALDINDDNDLGPEDALLLLEYLFQGGPPPAQPFPDAGLDPTPPGPGCDL